jgi:hypothetical protein
MDDMFPAIATPLSPELAQRQRAPEDLHAAAEQFEAIFIQTLLKQARQSKLADDILGSSAGDNYTEMLGTGTCQIYGAKHEPWHCRGAGQTIWPRRWQTIG